MSLATMQQRLNHIGGASQQNRMIVQKRKTMLQAIKYSYQGARFSKYIDNQLETAEFKGLFNPVTHNMDYDTKMISTDFTNQVKVGDLLCWRNTGQYWIIYAQDLTELAYFRGECRKCDYRVRWVDKDRELQETLISIVGPTPSTFRTSSSMQAAVAEDFPNNVLKVLVPDTEKNREYFNQYQEFLIKGISYQVNNIDNLSMPGIIQMNCKQHYVNLIENDVEQDIRNAWNVQPIIPEDKKSDTDFGIIGDDIIKPLFSFEYSTLGTGGQWYIAENFEVSPSQNLPVNITENDRTLNTIHVTWSASKSGSFTLVYNSPNVVYRKYIIVESLF